MNRLAMNFLIDVLSFLAMGATIATGVMIKYILPARSGGLRVWGWNRHDWGDVHFYLAVGLIALLLAHVTLHWHWIATTADRFLSRRNAGEEASGRPGRNLAAASVPACILIGFAGFLWAVSGDVERGHGAGASGGQGWARRSDVTQAGACTRVGGAGGSGGRHGGWSRGYGRGRWEGLPGTRDVAEPISTRSVRTGY